LQDLKVRKKKFLFGIRLGSFLNYEKMYRWLNLKGGHRSFYIHGLDFFVSNIKRKYRPYHYKYLYIVYPYNSIRFFKNFKYD
jgi:hypothetical protein